MTRDAVTEASVTEPSAIAIQGNFRFEHHVIHLNYALNRPIMQLSSGSLAFLKRYIKNMPVRVLHIDDSFEVLTEFQLHSEQNPETNILVGGIAVPGKRRAEGVTYFKNVKEVAHWKVPSLGNLSIEVRHALVDPIAFA